MHKSWNKWRLAAYKITLYKKRASSLKQNKTKTKQAFLNVFKKTLNMLENNFISNT